MAILQTAEALYAENREMSLLAALKESIKATISAALHPTNWAGKLFGYGSIFHTMSRRFFGEPLYEQGGIKNVFRDANIVKMKGKKDARSAKGKESQIAAQAQNAVRTGRTEVVQLNTLGRIELNTNLTVGYLQQLIEQMMAAQAATSPASEEEKTAEFARKLQNTLDQMPARPVAANDNEKSSPLSAILGLLGAGTMGVMSLGSGLLGALVGGLGAAGAFAMRFVPFGLPGILIGLALWRGYEGYQKYIEEMGKDGDVGRAIAEALNTALFGIPEALAEIIERVFGTPKDLYNRLGMNVLFGEWEETKPPPSPLARPQKTSADIAAARQRRADAKARSGGASTVSAATMTPAPIPTAPSPTATPAATSVGAGVNPILKQKFDALQKKFGKKLTITSGKRDAAHNAAVGGASGSQHLHGNALDITFSGSKEETLQLISLASSMGFGGIGVYGPGSLHLDVGERRGWGPDYKARSVPPWAKTAIQAHVAGAPVQAMASTGTGDYAAMTLAAAQQISAPSALDVTNATAARMAAADAASRATSMSQQQVSEASLVAAMAPKPSPPPAGMTRTKNGETAAPGMTQTGEAVDDIVAKILIAMGVVTAT